MSGGIEKLKGAVDSDGGPGYFKAMGNERHDRVQKLIPDVSFT